MDRDFGINLGLVEELYAQYLENPQSVDSTWREYFDSQNGGPPAVPSAYRSNGWPSVRAEISDNGTSDAALDQAFSHALLDGPSQVTSSVVQQAAVQARVYQLINAYRVRGHFFASIDPLGPPRFEHPELDLNNFGLTADDIDKPFGAVDLAGPEVRTLGEIIDWLEETYCRSIGVEYTHLEDMEARLWLQERMEQTRNRLELTRDMQLRILSKLSDAEILEQFIHRSYGAGTKRFSLEGAESLIPLLDLLIERAGDQGVREIVLGMAHRGRLNVLTNIMKKSLHEIFAAFEDADADLFRGGGDVKYHLGYSSDRVTEAGNPVHMTLTFNPSHLEFVNPVVEGRVRAKQDRCGDRTDRRRVMPLLIHGDAAFIGQGIVPETLNLASLEGYATGGTIHVIVNNQIGFTTNPFESRSTHYASDVARMVKIPVFHVNGEDPEAVAQVAMLAADFRQKFGQDVVIDMYCYRRYGHNEGDEPRYTQPAMYATIDKKPTIRQIYVKRLHQIGQVNEEQAEEIVRSRRDALGAALDEVKQKGSPQPQYAMGGLWKHYYGGPDERTPEVDTSVSRTELLRLAQKLQEYPDWLSVHPKILPMLKGRLERLENDEPFDWGTGETLAYATLLSEGTPVRLSGQDVRRGTFSHRHAVVFDTKSGEPFSPLSNVINPPARFEAFNSPLSEAGVLGFEYGYSLDSPDGLVIWEAQFGDFLNGAQVIVDQFITSCEDKWFRLSGLVLLLPHGYEGQGPEHSSARMERFLQNAAEDNIQVCNLTTPAQLFHCLRRQIRRPWRKPLVIMTPKSLLRVAATSKGPHRPVSTLEDLATGGFQRAIPDVLGRDPKDVKKIILCSGKVYYDLAIAREQRGVEDVAIIRVEQLYPLGPDLKKILEPYNDGTPLLWVQEEPMNYGGWYYALANLPEYLEGRFPLKCVARERSASPATGSRASHLLEQKQLIDQAFSA